MPGFELIGEEEKAAVAALFESGGVLFAHGFDQKRKGVYHVREFEQAFAKRFGAPHGLAVSSGTAALKVALKALGIGPGDEVITQAFTFIATVEAILDVGAVPIICNIDQSLNLCTVDFEARINSRTKAVIPVHMLGFPADMARICEIAKARGIGVIEDNCEAAGASLRGRALGTWGDIGVFSLDFGKVITCGEGGMVLSQRPELDRIAREYHDHGHENNPTLPRGRDTRTRAGFNYRMTEMQGVVGKVQLGRLDFILDQNRKRYEALETGFAGAAPVRHLFPDSVALHDTFMFRVEEPESRVRLVTLLHETGFGTKNVPDAVEWHFAGYWDHLFSREEIARMKPSAELLDQYIAVPIAFGKPVSAYFELGGRIAAALKG